MPTLSLSIRGSNTIILALELTVTKKRECFIISHSTTRPSATTHQLLEAQPWIVDEFSDDRMGTRKAMILGRPLLVDCLWGGTYYVTILANSIEGISLKGKHVKWIVTLGIHLWDEIVQCLLFAEFALPFQWNGYYD
eukprot:scaffold918_cov126-Cylindrotheca_fusiformis.AAC.45